MSETDQKSSPDDQAGPGTDLGSAESSSSNDPDLAKSALPSEQKKNDFPAWMKRLPNQLTWLRIACIPIVVVLLLDGDPVELGQPIEVRTMDVAAGITFALAAFTDFLDGWLARMLGAQSILGKLLDPLADKLLVVAAMIILVEKQKLAGWIAVVLIVRDLGINAIRLAANEDKISLDSSWLGKTKTLFLDVGIGSLMVHGMLWGIPFLLVGQVAIGLAVASSVLSAGHYLWQYGRELRARDLL